MSDEIKEALKQFNREDLIDDGYEHNDLDTGITVSLTLKQMIKYNQLQSNWNSLREINNEAREYLTSYEAISTIQGLDNIENNKQLDENTINEMTNRYLKVHHKLLSILDKMNELEGKDK